MKKITAFKFKILGKQWTLRVMTARGYQRANGKDSHAMNHCDDRRIDLSPTGVNFETIVHELTHGFIQELGMNSTELDRDQVEEMFCELVAKHGEALLHTAGNLIQKIMLTKESAT